MIDSTSRPPFAPTDLTTAVAYQGEQVLTFAEWDERANRLAASLALRGIGAGDAVAVRMRTRIEWLVVSLAIAKLEAVLVAVNYRLTPPEATYILRDCEVRAVILDDATTTEFLDAWAGLGLLAIVVFDDSTPGVLSYADLIRDGAPIPRPATRLAPLVIYSSGTTGTPKGAPVNGQTQDSDRQVIEDYHRSVAFDGAAGGPGNRTLVNLPMHHGAGPGYAQVALATGGSLVFQPRFDPEQTLALIERHRITHWTSVPTMLRRILALPAEIRDRYDTRSLRFLQTGAAPVGGELKQQVIAQFGDGCLYESYGCTEAGMIAGARPADQLAKPGTSGQPFRQVTLRIVDEAGRELPPGQSGEIIVRTPAVIAGYVGRGPLGADQLDAKGYYHTGDIGYLDSEGYLFIHDRSTDMIIAGGSNVYPAEIELVLSQHPAVAMVGVIGVVHPELGEQPVAYVELADGAVTDEAQLLAFCEGRLATYKWPRRVYFIDHVPVSPMGKILKRELRSLPLDEQATS